ncbi:hypothetical protein SKAU_G00368730 [Synaphobranchus kaupii]|uniref:Cadherin domain-containing protein n=1 Tax=Synaphobranchus kaupii TaxID=118154 RepID=A0A9Q1IFK8_SYNKA|nr:hypothetical protein SKAU_G00368730 [Synaphobranchus kaupii]
MTILVTIVLKCQKPKPTKATPPCRNSVVSQRSSTVADSTLVSNDAYWYSLFLAETRKGKVVVRQPIPKSGGYFVSSIPRSTGLTETSESAASTLQCQQPKPTKATPPCRNSVVSQRSSTVADSTLVSNDAYWYSLFLAETRKGKVVVRQPIPKSGGYIVSSIPRSTGLTETSESAASTLQSGQCTVMVYVEDVNDNYPEITVKSLRNTVKEHVPVGTVIALVGISDRDSGDNGRVDLSISEKLPFVLNKSSEREFELVVSESLDREIVPEYNIVLTVTDRGTPPLSDNETITLGLLDVNDNAPQFPTSFYTIPVMENNAPGSLLSSVTAFDPDFNENQYLVYFIIENEIVNTSVSMLFSINPENGDLYALKTFDFEREKEFLFHIEARDSGMPPLSSNVTVHIVILDQNDNTPVIVSPWRAHGSVVEEVIPRSTDKGYLIAKVIAIDTDSVQNSRVTYQFLQVADATLFSLDQYNGEIRTTRMFSYRDPRHHRLIVIAKDNGDPALSATVTIKLSTVEHCQKPKPTKTTPPCRNSVVSQRSSTVADSTLVSNDAYWYSLFLAETRKGKVVVRQPIPKSGGYFVSSIPRSTGLTETSESAASTLQCQKPKPTKATPPCRNSVVSQRSSTVADSTLVSNDAYWYSLFLAETRKGKVVVRQPIPKSGGYFVSSIPRSTGLTETSESAASTLQAKDNGHHPLSGQCTVMVYVEDVNDNYPEITVKSLRSTVKETVPVGTVIALVGISDRDSGDNGKVDLSIGEQLPFVLNKSSERDYELVVSESLDREIVPEYNIILTVTDRGTPPLSDNETITLVLLDVNDNAPQFEKSFYTIPVIENNAPGSLLSSVTAFDPDFNENQYLVYFIIEREIMNTSMSMLFSINPENGDLYALKTFDYEREKEFLFHIEARDSGVPPLSSNVTVHIIILDQNDNTPVIVSPWRAHGSVVEEVIPRSTDKGYLIAKVIAIDTDSVQNSRVTYQFLQIPDATLFSLDQYNGEIRTMRMFSYRDPRHQRLVVIAKDNGDPALSSTVTIKLSTVEHVVKAFSETSEVPLEYDIFSDLNLYLLIGLGSVSFLLLMTILVTIVLKCQKPKPTKATPPCRNSVVSQRSSTVADSTLVSNDAYWYSLFLAETRKGKVVVRQPIPKSGGYFVSSIPRSTGLTETSESAASTLQVR